MLPQTSPSGPLLTLRRADATNDGGYTFQEQWFVDAKWTSPNMQVAHEVQERRHVLPYAPWLPATLSIRLVSTEHTKLM